jgi:cytidylate kinase/CBS domain-containing protein
MAIISVCRAIHSGGEALAENLGQRLGFRVFSREAVVVEAAKRYGVSEEELIDSLRSPPSFWDKLSHKRQRFILALVATLGEIVRDDDVVYHGIAGHMLLRELPNVLKLRLVMPMETRIRSAMAAHNLSHEAAIRIIQESDARRSTWMRRMYNVSATDTSLYDMVINLDQMSIESATDLIAEFLKRDEFQSTPETRRELEDFALRLRIQAELTFKSDFPEESIDVSVHEGIVGITIAASARGMRDAIVKYVEQIPGVTEVDTGERSTPDRIRPAAQAQMTAADLMISFKRYPHINQSVSIKEAVMAITASSVVLSDGHIIVPRYLLVLDDNERLVGVINRRHLLRGLTPQYGSMMKARERLSSKMGITSGMMSTSLMWDALFGPAAINAARRPVSSIMIPASVSVAPDDTLGTVVSVMLQNDINVLPVAKGGKTVGVVLMSEVFDNVAEFIIESGTKSKAAG